ncbi:hypothetical protein FZI85_19860 [Mycobacterium sp. CBMA293]|uniref:hypothetical protein n=1 Tax=unclassified Mycolicibacterium TaxID=2636767 RepID=UPI0012DDF618|nr:MULTISPECIES: hypothetical protein [unclassified Mycolicibacterium]MUL49048.1 hypothetical protein [Mycolicibacterium sp. CBMA 360]MUL60938.1 hypothetical protein [Mycolicibacterium sp. CBMA 335]MUL71951.1 hypothetical protein [Mycolicibacterium sp. CBMA 311]MUL95879.1 hypothetical protein [Mycolicibacterium sp. CBMA 230]MUM09026.1 hypothetical protein [Mycolicibacterium sp. CBMA 213]
MSRGSSSGGSSAGGAVFLVFVLIALVPKPVWIMLGVFIAVAVLTWICHQIVVAVQRSRAEARERARQERAERARREKQWRIDTMGERNAALVESVLRAVEQIAASEAARSGWLGDVAFGPDIIGITSNFEKAHALHSVTGQLSALDKPSAADRKLLAEARATIANLERAATERAELIGKCAMEAQHIDASLRAEREDALVAEQRAELHAKLSAMLYGIETARDTAAPDSAVDAVMARVQAYREIKHQIQLARDDEPR